MAKKRKNKKKEEFQEDTLVIPTANHDALNEYLRSKSGKSFDEHFQSFADKIAEGTDAQEGLDD